jgi:hypothetical protein
MPARARTPQDPAPAAAGAAAGKPAARTPATRPPAGKPPTAKPPAAKPPTAKPPAGDQDDRTTLEARVRTLEQTVNAVIATASANQRAVGSILRHLGDLVSERLVPPPPPPPPIQPGRPTRPR